MNNKTHKEVPSGFGKLRPAGKRCRTVYIVDNDPAVCHALSLLFGNANYAVKSFGSARTLLAAVTEQTTGVLILDLSVADMSGLALQAELRKRGIGLKTIFISGHGNIEKSVLAIKGGAIDFIEKPFSEKHLLNSVAEALLLVDAEAEERRQHESMDKRYELLTPREREVMKFLVSGDSNRELAERLGLSSRTVEIHRSKIMRKMKAGSLQDLVRMVFASSKREPEEVLIDISRSLRLQEDQSG
jgi:two-component system, LuxR family, response regulator FixJ